MKKKTPSIFLTNGKKNICSYYKVSLVHKAKTFEMKGKKPQDTKQVEETILFCQECHRYYISQELCCQLAKKHPGYHIDVALYKLKSKKRKKANHSQITDSKFEENSPDSNNSIVNTQPDEQKNIINSQKPKTVENALNAPVLLSNTYNFYHNICPKCSSVLIREKVNIPVLNENGDFYRYYTKAIKYCCKCQKGYVDKEIIISILSTMSRSTQQPCNVELANVRTQYNKYNLQYQYIPTLDNDNAIFFPVYDYLPNASDSSSLMSLNEQSFLGKMGYTVSKNDYTRQHILSNAVILYGKRKVADHLSFLIETRRNQVGGRTKYTNAIRIWQKDLNFVSELDASLYRGNDRN